MAPNQVTKDTEVDICWKLYSPKQRTHQKILKSKSDTQIPHFKFKVDDKVRISHLKHYCQERMTRNSLERSLRLLNVT